jgi:hypothetical protein
MASLTKKMIRKIDRAQNQLFGPNGFFVPKLPDAFKAEDAFGRQVILASGHTVHLTDAGISSLDEIAKTLDESDTFNGDAAYGDIWSACTDVFRDLLSKSHRPDDGNEFVALIKTIVAGAICERTFVAPLHGIELIDIDSVILGSLRVVKPTLDFIQQSKVSYSGDDAARFVEQTKHALWLVGTTRGTDRVALKRFREKANLATGVVSIVAASLYERGAHAFRIGVALTPEESYGRGKYLSWNEPDKKLVVTLKFSRAQLLRLDSKIKEHLESSVVGKRAFSILESQSRSDIEEAVVRAIQWYSDAHRDEVPVMRLLKYWSCVEAFFSDTDRKISASVSIGLAAILTHGHVQAFPRADYHSVRRRIGKLYDQRSKATHRAIYDHVTFSEVAELSQWVSWLILTAIIFIEQGARATLQLKGWSHNVHAQASRSLSAFQRAKDGIAPLINLIRRVAPWKR